MRRTFAAFVLFALLWVAVSDASAQSSTDSALQGSYDEALRWSGHAPCRLSDRGRLISYDLVASHPTPASVRQYFDDWVAFYQDFLHGTQAQHYELCDVETGRLLETWNGEVSTKAPSWTAHVQE